MIVLEHAFLLFIGLSLFEAHLVSFVTSLALKSKRSVVTILCIEEDFVSSHLVK